MILKIDVPIRKEELIQYLSELENPKYKYLGKEGMLTLKFEAVDTTGEYNDLQTYTKNLLKNLDITKNLYIRVLEDRKAG